MSTRPRACRTVSLPRLLRRRYARRLPPLPSTSAPPGAWACLLLLSALFPAATLAQEAGSARAPADTVQAPPTSAPLPGVAPGSPGGGEGGLNQPVQFSGDSLAIQFDEANGNEGALFGEATVTYGDAKLDAHQIDILFEIDELRASGLPSDTGMVGRPAFQEGGGETFYGNQLAYNMGTERGRVVGAQTQIEDGFVSGEVVKMTEDSTVYLQGGSYTTCDCPPGETPSYSLRAARMKIVNQQWIYTGPIQLFLFNIPTPLWLPFGFLPATEGRRSGPLPPNYGEDELGFFLRGWGWYWAINDYMDLQLQGGIWTKGSWQVTPRYRYSKRYRYSGNLLVDYMQNRRGERGDPNPLTRHTVRIGWTHRQTISPTFNFNSNVNLSSSGYLRAVSESYNDRVTQSIQSSINLSKRWPGASRSLTLNASQQQTLSTGAAQLELPTLSFTQGSRKPFARDVRPAGARERFYEKITYSYNARLSNRYRFDPLPVDTLLARGDSAAAGIAWYEALVSPEKYERATGDNIPFHLNASHNIPIGASFSVRRLPIINKTFILNLSPSFSYTEDWFVSTERRAFDDSTGRVARETVPGFFALRQFSSSLSANTTFYGTFPVGIGPYQGVRHTVRPSLSFTYQPDFSGDFWGYTRTYRDGNDNIVAYPIVNGVRQRLQQAVSFSLSNVFETKRVERDSTGARQDRTLKLFNLDVRSSYNFAADSLKFSAVSLSARTSILGEVDVQLSSSFSPYRLDRTRGVELDEYVFSPRRLHLVRLTGFNLSARTDLRGGQSQGGRPYESPRAGIFDPGDPMAPPPPGVPPIDPDDPFAPAYDPYYNGTQYADFAIPWSLNLSFTYAYRPARTASAQTNRSAILNTTFDFGLTPNWRLNGSSGYDFSAWELSTTSLSILRDFECWQMSISWTPFGRYQSYSFNLQVKSGKLRDILRLNQPRAGIKNRFGGLLGR